MKLATDTNGDVVQALGFNSSTTQNTAITATSASLSMPSHTKVVRIYVTEACFIAMNEAATTSHMPMPSGAVEYFTVTKSATINVIGTTGLMYVTEMN